MQGRGLQSGQYTVHDYGGKGAEKEEEGRQKVKSYVVSV